MGFGDTLANFLGVASNKTVEELQIQLATQELLLKDDDEMRRAVTYSSSNAREVHDKKDVQGLVLKRVNVKDLQLLYLNNQFIYRGVNVRADELVSRSYDVFGPDKDGVDKCFKLIEDSGGPNLFWQSSVNTDVAGDGYLEKIYNQARTAIMELRHVNPLNFGFETEEENRNKIVVDSNGQPVGFQQTYYDNEGVEQRKKVPKEVIEHLRFSTFGDEFNGVSSLQSVYNTAIRLMNMEHSAAEAAVKTANPTWVVKTKSKSPKDLNIWSRILGRISGREVVFLPDGVDVDLKSPGNQNFSQYSSYFLDAVVAALGVPKSILTGSSESGGGNRATINTLSRHFYSLIRVNQRYVEILINRVFKEYGELAGFEAPELRFNDVAEDADRNGQRAIELEEANLITIEEAREMVGLESNDDILAQLEERRKVAISTPAVGKIDPNKETKKQDMETFFPEKNGSQKGNKAKQKINPDVPSV